MPISILHEHCLLIVSANYEGGSICFLWWVEYSSGTKLRHIRREHNTNILVI